MIYALRMQRETKKRFFSSLSSFSALVSFFLGMDGRMDG